jgi:hypothetical protein
LLKNTHGNNGVTRVIVTATVALTDFAFVSSCPVLDGILIEGTCMQKAQKRFSTTGQLLCIHAIYMFTRPEFLFAIK